MFKVLLISLGIFLLLRPLVRFGLSYFVKKSLNDLSKNQQAANRKPSNFGKPEGTVTVEEAKADRDSDYTDYEEVN